PLRPDLGRADSRFLPGFYRVFWTGFPAILLTSAQAWSTLRSGQAEVGTMADEKAKGTEAEKAAIRELLNSGHTVEEVCAKYAHIDGRVISGIAARIRQAGAREAGGGGGGGAPADTAP